MPQDIVTIKDAEFEPKIAIIRKKKKFGWRFVEAPHVGVGFIFSSRKAAIADATKFCTEGAPD